MENSLAVIKSTLLILIGGYIKSEQAKSTVLFMHGNAWNISYFTDAIDTFNTLGMNVFLFDYRGYGKSEGKPSQTNTYEDAKAAWDYLIDEKGLRAEEIIIVERSLGGAIASQLASYVKPKALILESTFTDIKELAQRCS